MKVLVSAASKYRVTGEIAQAVADVLAEHARGRLAGHRRGAGRHAAVSSRSRLASFLAFYAGANAAITSVAARYPGCPG